MLSDIANKEPQKETGPSHTVNTIQINSDTETSSSSSPVDEVKPIHKAFQKLELKRITKQKVNPTSLTNDWYPRPTPPDIQFKERNFSSQFSISANKLYEWNIDGLFEQGIPDKLQHMFMVSNTYFTNHEISQLEIADLLVTGFTGTLRSWWEKNISLNSPKIALSMLSRRMGKEIPCLTKSNKEYSILSTHYSIQ
jgi:hypothetical protein